MNDVPGRVREEAGEAAATARARVRTPEPTSARGGPSVLQRIAGGAVAVGVLAAVFLFDRDLGRPWIATALALLFGAVACIELFQMLARSGRPCHPRLGAALGILYLVGRAAWLLRADAGPPFLGYTEFAFLAFALVLFAAEVVRGEPANGLARLAHDSFVLVYVVLFGVLLDVLLRPPPPLGVELALYVVFTAKCNDIGGFLIGRALAGPKLAPRVSPGKTISGSLGGVALAVVFALVMRDWMGPHAGADSVLFVAGWAVAVSVATQLGDLAESLIKRACGVKDSSHLVPTFGGALDMVDSLVPAAALGYGLLLVGDQILGS